MRDGACISIHLLSVSHDSGQRLGAQRHIGSLHARYVSVLATQASECSRTTEKPTASHTYPRRYRRRMQPDRAPARKGIYQTWCVLLDAVGIYSFCADREVVRLSWDIDRYSDAIGVGNTGQNVNLEAQLKTKWPPLLPDTTVVLDEPCVLLDQHSRILAWVLPGVLHVNRQVGAFIFRHAPRSLRCVGRERYNWRRPTYQHN